MEIQHTYIPWSQAAQRGWPMWAVARTVHYKKDGTPVVSYFVRRSAAKKLVQMLELGEIEGSGTVNVEELMPYG